MPVLSAIPFTIMAIQALYDIGQSLSRKSSTSFWFLMSFISSAYVAYSPQLLIYTRLLIPPLSVPYSAIFLQMLLPFIT
jgi:hypothetical protein